MTRYNGSKGNNQAVETPQVFIDAVEDRFGKLNVDLAATFSNTKCNMYLGENSKFCEDSLSYDWSNLSGNLWLNPEFKRIKPWAKKASDTRLRGNSKIIILTPASVGTNWFRDYVYRKAKVIFLNGRITFVGEKDSFPKDLMLFVFGLTPCFDVWQWKKQLLWDRKCIKNF